LQSFGTGSFIYVVCQVGAEAALKKELARTHPELKFAYSRPGFITFKNSSPTPLGPDFVLNSVFARQYGLSLSKLTAEDGNANAKAKKALELEAQAIHIFEIDQYKPGEEPPGFEPFALTKPAVAAIEDELKATNKAISVNQPPEDGERVLDLIILKEDEWWIGLHTHSGNHSPFPGGKPRIDTPAEAPSRAYVKLEEGLLWSGAPLKTGDVAVEIGSAPGGASYALLKRGLTVIGIDPAQMAPQVLKEKGFKHIARPIADVNREELPASVQWLLVDMNVEPRISLYAVDRMSARMKDSLLGVLLTIKLNNWKMAEEIPHMLEHVKAMGMAKLRATQLASNRQEIFVYGLTRRGAARSR
jgi:23S rRNA (cytidine2498-2'-O)-methyltransferase